MRRASIAPAEGAADYLADGSLGRELPEAQGAALSEDLPCGDPEEAAWARAAAAGDRRAFGRLYQRFARTVHGILVAISGADRSEDLLQEVFLKALRCMDDLKEPRSIGAWLRAIARNVARDALRARVITAPLPEDILVTDAPAAEAREVLDLVRSLPEAYRETLVLRLVEGMTGPEIASRTGLTPGSVRVNLCRGMKLLMGRLKERGWTV